MLKAFREALSFTDLLRTLNRYELTPLEPFGTSPEKCPTFKWGGGGGAKDWTGLKRMKLFNLLGVKALPGSPVVHRLVKDTE